MADTQRIIITDEEDVQNMVDLASKIDKKLQNRQDKDDLIQKNILKEKNNNLLDAQSQLAGKILRRPSKTELEDRNILKEEKSESSEEDDNAQYVASPTVDKRQKSFGARQQQLKSILKKRPEKGSLTERNILKTESMVDPSLTAATEKLKKAQLHDSLENKIRDRPSPESVDKIINFREVVEVVPTWKSTEYNRKTDETFTFKRLTPKLKQEIREELNTFKRDEMDVHTESLKNTAYH